jgi:hypothetical protein
VNDYFTATVTQLQERTKHLVSLIPRDLGREVDALVVTCRDRLAGINRRLARLLELPEFSRPENQLFRLRHLRRAVDELDFLEAVAIAALRRWNDEDRRMNRLTERIAREIAYPLSTPVATCSSQTYYHTYTHLGLIRVPLAESRFLLHIPDLYHELGHPLLEIRNDPRIEPFQSHCARALNAANEYLATELEREASGRGPQAFKAYLSTWLRCWEAWAVELFCDLYALYVVGPAFAWSHFHLCALRGNEDPFRLPTLTSTEHPPDAARMAALLEGLRLIFYDAAADSIEQRWIKFLGVVGAQPSPEYRRCFPESLIRQIANAALEGTRAIGCNIAQPAMSDPIRMILNEAWQHFWSSPTTYVQWEEDATKKLQP